MQLADYLVSYALHLNNRCLKAMGGATEPLAVHDLKDLSLQTERLLACWQLLREPRGKATCRDAESRLRRIRVILREAMGLRGDGNGLAPARGGEQIRQACTTERGRRALHGVTEALAARHPFVALPVLSAEDLDELSFLFQVESEAWRDAELLRDVTDAMLIESGFVRVFDKGRRGCKRLLDRGARRSGTARQGSYRRASPGPKTIMRARRWVCHGVHHMELLRPGLSEASRARRWYLQRLQVNLTKLLEIELFRREIRELVNQSHVGGGHDEDFDGALDGVISERLRRLMIQSGKLAAGAYGRRTEEFRKLLVSDVENLGLQEIVLLSADRPVRLDAS